MIRPITNITALAKEDLIIHCYVNGFPIEEIKWHQGNTNDDDDGNGELNDVSSNVYIMYSIIK